MIIVSHASRDPGDVLTPTLTKRVLVPSTVEALFQNEIRQFSGVAYQGTLVVKPDLTSAFPEIHPVPGLHVPAGMELDNRLKRCMRIIRGER